MLIGHPGFRRLRDYALAARPGDVDRRVARHLLRCTACRDRVQRLREFMTDARERRASAPPLFPAIAARAEAGETVALEYGGSDARRTRPHMAAAAILATLVIGASILAVAEAGAEKSELWITPVAPRAGETLALQYRATSRLSGQDRLIVRGRYAWAGMGRDTRTVVLGELHRVGRNEYRGSITLPDSAVYAVLAVEDMDATFVDVNAERWEVVVHGDDARPLLHALHRRYLDASGRNTRLSDDALQAMVELYPADPASWYFFFRQQSLQLSGTAADSLRAVRRAEFPRLEAAARAADRLDGDAYWYLIMYADALGDTDTRNRLRSELIARFPTHPAAMHQASNIAWSKHREDVTRYLAALDSLWQLAPAAAVAGFWSHARGVALETGDRDIALRWIERIEAMLPAAYAAHGLSLIANPHTRDAGMTRLRAAIAGRNAATAERPLSQDRTTHEAALSRARGMYFVALGRALVDSGQPLAALDTLSRALETGWNPALFRAVADARLLLGDTVGAIASYARLVADPNTPAVFTDSLGARLGADRMRGAAWSSAVDDAAGDMRRELLGTSINRRPLRAQLRLRDTRRRAVHFPLDDQQTLTVVAFWSRYCPWSVQELPRLAGIAHDLEESGIRFIAVTDESDGEAVAKYLAENGHDLATYLDPERDAQLAFDSRTTPHYVVLDRAGRIRFTSHAADDLVRHVAVLSGHGRE